MAGTDVKDHNPMEVKIAVSLLIKSVRKETGSRLRVNQFRPKTLDLAREYFRCLNSEINRVRSKFCSMLFPVFAGALIGQPDLVRRRIIGVDCEVAIVDFLSAKRLPRRKKKSEKEKPAPAHKIQYLPWDHSRGRSLFKTGCRGRNQPFVDFAQPN